MVKCKNCGHPAAWHHDRALHQACTKEKTLNLREDYPEACFCQGYRSC